MRSIEVIKQDLLGVMSEQPLARIAGTHEHREHLDDREEKLMVELVDAGLSVDDAGAVYDQCVTETNAHRAALAADTVME